MERCAHGARRSVHYGHKHADASVGFANELVDIPAWQQDRGASHAHYTNMSASNLVAGAAFGPALVKVGAVMKHVQELSRDGLVVMENSLGSLPKSTDDELRRIKECRRKFAESDLEWAQAVKRAHSVRKESEEASSAADLSFVDAKLAFECSRFELVAALNEIETTKQVELFDAVRSSVTAMTQYYEQSVGHMRELAAHLDALAPAIAERRDEQLAERARNRATVAHLKRLREEHKRGVRLTASDGGGGGGGAAGGAAAVACPAVGADRRGGPRQGGLLVQEVVVQVRLRQAADGHVLVEAAVVSAEDGVLYYQKRSQGRGRRRRARDQPADLHGERVDQGDGQALLLRPRLAVQVVHPPGGERRRAHVVGRRPARLHRAQLLRARPERQPAALPGERRVGRVLGRRDRPDERQRAPLARSPGCAATTAAPTAARRARRPTGW